MAEKGLRPGLPPRDRNAAVPEHAGRPRLWIGGVVALIALLGLVLFGTTRMDDSTASNPDLDTERGTTTGVAPASPAGKQQ